MGSEVRQELSSATSVSCHFRQIAPLSLSFLTSKGGPNNPIYPGLWSRLRDNAQNVLGKESRSGKTLNKKAITVFIISITDRECTEPNLVRVKPEADRWKAHNRDTFHTASMCLGAWIIPDPQKKGFGEMERRASGWKGSFLFFKFCLFVYLIVFNQTQCVCPQQIMALFSKGLLQIL